MKTLTVIAAATALYFGLEATFLVGSVEGVVSGIVAVAASLYLANKLDLKDRERGGSSFRDVEME